MPFKRGIGAAEGVDPAIHRIGGARADARDAQGRRLAQAALDEAAHGDFRRDPAALCAAHAVRERRHEADS